MKKVIIFILILLFLTNIYSEMKILFPTAGYVWRHKANNSLILKWEVENKLVF